MHMKLTMWRRREVINSPLTSSMWLYVNSYAHTHTHVHIYTHTGTWNLRCEGDVRSSTVLWPAARGSTGEISHVSLGEFSLRARWAVCMRECLYVYMHIHTYVCMYVCMYVWFYGRNQPRVTGGVLSSCAVSCMYALVCVCIYAHTHMCALYRYVCMPNLTIWPVWVYIYTLTYTHTS
jgi:hypothetical protein